MGDSCRGKVALVTGASRGIGAATARRLAAEGADVAAEHEGTGVAVNAVSPLAATATEGVLASIAAGQIPEHLTEPLETMVEAILALATADAAKLAGRIAYSLPLLRDLGRPVRDLSGHSLVEGWQPDGLPDRIAVMEKPWR